MDLNTALKILQIDDNYSSLTKEKLKNNYKKLSMIYHPDRNIGEDIRKATKIFQKINKSYQLVLKEMLLDERLDYKEYDQLSSEEMNNYVKNRKVNEEKILPKKGDAYGDFNTQEYSNFLNNKYNYASINENSSLKNVLYNANSCKQKHIGKLSTEDYNKIFDFYTHKYALDKSVTKHKGDQLKYFDSSSNSNYGTNLNGKHMKVYKYNGLMNYDDYGNEKESTENHLKLKKAWEFNDFDISEERIKNDWNEIEEFHANKDRIDESLPVSTKDIKRADISIEDIGNPDEYFRAEEIKQMRNYRMTAKENIENDISLSGKLVDNCFGGYLTQEKHYITLEDLNHDSKINKKLSYLEDKF